MPLSHRLPPVLTRRSCSGVSKNDTRRDEEAGVARAPASAAWATPARPGPTVGVEWRGGADADVPCEAAAGAGRRPSPGPLCPAEKDNRRGGTSCTGDTVDPKGVGGSVPSRAPRPSAQGDASAAEERCCRRACSCLFRPIIHSSTTAADAKSASTISVLTSAPTKRRTMRPSRPMMAQTRWFHRGKGGSRQGVNGV